MKRQAKIEIQNALVDLMAEYPFQEISTKMICAYCNINRSTFMIITKINLIYWIPSTQSIKKNSISSKRATS